MACSRVNFTLPYFIYCLKWEDSFHQEIVNLRKKRMNCDIWIIALYGAETWTLRIGQKYLERFEMCAVEGCRRSVGPIVWKIKKYYVKGNRNILHTIKRTKAIWIGIILRRNFLLKRFIEGKIEGTGRRGRRRKQLLDDLKETRT
jgi:hypothetical protein